MKKLLRFVPAKQIYDYFPIKKYQVDLIQWLNAQVQCDHNIPMLK